MRIRFLDPDGNVIACRLPFDGADHLIVANHCPECEAGPGFKVRGSNRTHDHDTYRAPAACLACGAWVGTIETTVSTVFGIDEDHAVLHGRPRVY